MTKPTLFAEKNFTHDCTTCRFLGSAIAGGHMVDLYVHTYERGDHTYIARYSSDGPDYWSSVGSLIQGHDAALYLAKMAGQR